MDSTSKDNSIIISKAGSRQNPGDHQGSGETALYQKDTR